MPGDTELRTKGVFEEGATPLYQFSEGLGLRGPTTGELLGESRQITERRAGRLEETGAELARQSKDRTTLQEEQARVRAAERPAPYTPEKPPDLAARPFLSPPQSVLGQLQNLMIGIGQIATGFAGTKGKGYAIGATAALKGAVEGWQAGDADRTQRALEQWKIENDRLLQAHRSARERYQDILEDQTRTMQDRMSQIEMTARIAGFQDLAESARSGDLDRVLKVVEAGKDREVSVMGLAAQINHYRALQEQAKATGLRQERGLKFREEAGERAERRTKVYEEFAGGQVKLEQLDVSLSNKLQTLDLVEDAVKIMTDRKLLPTGPTTPDAFRAALKRQTAWGDPQVKWAVDIIERLGTGLVVGSEIALGEPASVMRLRAIAEPQAGHILTMGALAWKTVFDRYRPFLKEQQKMTRSHLRARDRGPAPREIEASDAEWGD